MPARNSRRHGLTVATALFAALFLPVLSGCHFSVGTNADETNAPSPSVAADPGIPKRDVEQITAQLIQKKSGGGPYVITCPTDLPIELDATMQCVVADQQGTHRELTVTVTKADSPNNATWDWEVGKEISHNR